MPSLCTLPRRTPALSRTRILLLALLVAAPLLGAARPEAASASTTQFSIMMDDDLLLYRGPVIQEQTLRRMKGLGVDYVRATVLWSLAAENVRSTRARRKRFNAARPSTYPHRNWNRYDDLVRAAKRVGIGVYFNVTGPGPDFAHGKAPRSQRRNRRTWRPKAREYYKFVVALGTRYNGAYVDENQGRQVLPRVSFWSLWNEPNQGGWLTPQYSFSRKLRRLIPASPRSTASSTSSAAARSTAPGTARTSSSRVRRPRWARARWAPGPPSGPRSSCARCSASTRRATRSGAVRRERAAAATSTSTTRSARRPGRTTPTRRTCRPTSVTPARTR